MAKWKIAAIIAGAAVAVIAAGFLLPTLRDSRGAPTTTEESRTTFAEKPTLSLPAQEEQSGTEPSSTAEESSTTALPPASTTAAPPQSTTAATTKPTTTTRPATSSSTTTSSGAAEKTTLPANLRDKSGIVEYFNKALNNGKSSCRSVTQTTDRVVLNEFAMGSFDLTTIAGVLINRDIRVEQNKSRNDLPVQNLDYASKLSVSGVESASCESSGENYIITVKLKPESGALTQTNCNTGKLFLITSLEDNSSDVMAKIRKLLGMDSFDDISYKMSLSGARVVITVNKSSGKIQSSYYSIRVKINGTNEDGQSAMLYDALDEKEFKYKWT
ncbi:MAG: hypothetical protein LBQ80_03320 [Clostridium sp.]|jgi:hypothetical protein|nr:hypothetical protein [Clostridium sp.]